METDKQKVNDIIADKDKLSFFEKKAKPYKDVTVADLIKLYVRQEGRCGLCGDDIDLDTTATHIDHIEPRARGGEDLVDNFEFACAICNYAKRDTSMKDFVLMCLKVQNEFYKTDLLPKDQVNAIVQRRWKREQKQKNNAS